MTPDRLLPLLKEFESKRVLVVGDLMLDEFIWGRVSRISPEAPVPVVEVQRESCYPGGAANVARNLVRFSKHIAMLGIVGSCGKGAQLRTLLQEEGINTTGVIESPEHQTIVKTRIIARHQQVVRVDRERKSAASPETIAKLLDAFDKALPHIDAVIIEDYGKGLFTQSFADEIIARAKKQDKIVTVDPNPHNPLTWSNVDVVKPNRIETLVASGLPDHEPGEPIEADPIFKKAAQILLQKWGTRLLLVTLGEYGMLLYDQLGEVYHTPTRARQVLDLSGAGDTSIALFTLALAAGATPREAAEIANHAAGVVVGKLGTETLSPDELIQSFETLE